MANGMNKGPLDLTWKDSLGRTWAQMVTYARSRRDMKYGEEIAMMWWIAYYKVHPEEGL